MTITLENLDINYTLDIYKNCKLIDNVTLTGSTYNYTITENGIYTFINRDKKEQYFYLDDETKCKVFDNLCKEKIFYYYTALTLVSYCVDQTKACQIYQELINLLDDDCDCNS